MKKRLLTGLMVSGLIFAAGCSSQTGTGTTQNNTSSGTVSDGVEAVTPKITDETTSTVADAAGQGQSTPEQSSQANDIGEEIARATAVEHAGLTESDVTFIKVQMDRDDGRTVYDVEFYYNNTEYDYEIDAATGEIVSYDSDIENYDIQARVQQSGNVITLDQAKEAALAAAGLNASDVKWVKEKLDYDDGRSVYELEGISGNQEYDFEINAADGTVLEQSRESVYDD